MLLYKLIFLAIFLGVLSGCGFKPIYGTGPNSFVRNEMRHIEIKPIKDRIGQQLRNHLESDITPRNRAYPTKYVLFVILSETKQALAIKKSKIATRANLNFVADYRLENKTNKTVLAKGSSRITTKYNVLTETFATLMAEKDARSRAVREISADIATKIAVFFERDNRK